MIAEQRLDIALVTSLPRDTPDAIVKLAQADISLLVDKPVTRTAADSAEPPMPCARGVTALVGLTNRLAGGWPDMRTMVQSGRLGRLLSAEAVFVTSSVAVRDPKHHLFSSERHGHGILHWLGCHWVDALLWVSGERIVEVQSMAANVLGEEIDVEDAISVAFRFSGGALGTMHFVNAFPRPNSDGYLAFRGVAGWSRSTATGCSRSSGLAHARIPCASSGATTRCREPGGYGPSSVVAIDTLLRCVTDRTPSPITLDDMAAALEVIDAAYQSADAGGTRVTIPEPARS